MACYNLCVYNNGTEDRTLRFKNLNGDYEETIVLANGQVYCYQSSSGNPAEFFLQVGGLLYEWPEYPVEPQNIGYSIEECHLEFIVSEIACSLVTPVDPVEVTPTTPATPAAPAAPAAPAPTPAPALPSPIAPTPLPTGAPVAPTPISCTCLEHTASGDGGIFDTWTIGYLDCSLVSQVESGNGLSPDFLFCACEDSVASVGLVTVTEGAACGSPIAPSPVAPAPVAPAAPAPTPIETPVPLPNPVPTLTPVPVVPTPVPVLTPVPVFVAPPTPVPVLTPVPTPIVPSVPTPTPVPVPVQAPIPPIIVPAVTPVAERLTFKVHWMTCAPIASTPTSYNPCDCDCDCDCNDECFDEEYCYEEEECEPDLVFAPLPNIEEEVCPEGPMPAARPTTPVSYDNTIVSIGFYCQ